jgi:hypothetical protein
MKLSWLAKQTGLSHGYVTYLAREREIPGCRRTKRGRGHYRVWKSKALDEWIEFHQKQNLNSRAPRHPPKWAKPAEVYPTLDWLICWFNENESGIKSLHPNVKEILQNYLRPIVRLHDQLNKELPKH